jgi:FSR family fosmidomycin resistance protein-like MFS transporter
MATLTATAPLRHDASTIGVVSIAHGLSHFCQLMVPPLFPWIGASYGLSNTQLGLLMSVFFVVSFLGQAGAGFVVDRYGAARVLYGGLALLAVAALGLGASPNYAVMLVFMALAGLGNCVFHPVDFSILNARVSATRLGHAYAAHGISGNLGWALAPVFVVGIAQGTGSWRMALFAVAGLVAAVLAGVWLFREWLVVQAAPAARAVTGAPSLAPGSGAAAAGRASSSSSSAPSRWARCKPSRRPRQAACTTCRPRRWPCACRSSWPVRRPAWCWADTWRATRGAVRASWPPASAFRRWWRC